MQVSSVEDATIYILIVKIWKLYQNNPLSVTHLKYFCSTTVVILSSCTMRITLHQYTDKTGRQVWLIVTLEQKCCNERAVPKATGEIPAFHWL